MIVAEGQIRTAEDRLRTLVMNPSQPDFWTTKLEPSEQPTLTPQPIDVDAARSRTRSRTAPTSRRQRKQIEQTDIGLKYSRNQKLPALDVTANYDLVGTAGTQRQFVLDPRHRRAGRRRHSRSGLQRRAARRVRQRVQDLERAAERQLSDRPQRGGRRRSRRASCSASSRRPALQDLETQVVASVRDAGRQVSTSLKRVESTRKARELAEQSLQAEEKRLAVGLSDTFRCSRPSATSPASGSTS